MDAVLTMPKGLGAVHVGQMLAMPSLSSAHKVKQLGTAEEMIRNIVSVAEKFIIYVIEKKTVADFAAARNQIFPQYFDAVRALSDLARIVVPVHVLEVLSAESFSETEAEFRDLGLTAFGTAVRDQAMFTVWTLRKISDLCQRIDQAELSPSLQDSDNKLFNEFVFHAVGARFHLDCLQKAMQLGRPLYPGVQDLVIDGLRNAVNAYAWARRAYDLRVPCPQTDNLIVQWDEEDQQLLDEASFDMIPEPI